MDGSTSVVMAVTSRYIMVANAGDSRAVLMDGDKVALSVCLPACLCLVCLCLYVAHSRTVVHVNIQAVSLSCDHKPSRPDEMKRIEKSGGFVMHLGVPRVNGVLAVSRALGDAELKHLVPSQPEYRTLSRRCVVPEVSQPE